MDVLEKATRQTKYCKQIEAIVAQLGHASNAEILRELQLRFPEVSATTVHRATARLTERGTLAVAPNDNNGAMRYDANTKPHDHFLCIRCGILKDVDIADQITPLLKQAISDCGISGRITISGTCKICSKRGKP